MFGMLLVVNMVIMFGVVCIVLKFIDMIFVCGFVDNLSVVCSVLVMIGMLLV